MSAVHVCACVCVTMCVKYSSSIDRSYLCHRLRYCCVVDVHIGTACVCVDLNSIENMTVKVLLVLPKIHGECMC